MTERTRKPVSKRLRYEVLRRDNHTCRYCGASAPDVQLTVDHVLPVALGGDNSPGNLVASCRDCNAGKTSSAPDAPMVEQVNEDAIRWARAMQTVLSRRAADRENRRLNHDAFREMWDAWTFRGETFDLAADWRTTIDRHMDNGLDMEDFDELIDVAMTSKSRDPWKYFNGCCWRRLDDIHNDIAAEIQSVDEADVPPWERPVRTSWTESDVDREIREMEAEIGHEIPPMQHCNHDDPSSCTDQMCRFQHCVGITAIILSRRIADA